jgi:hypothetical protein
MLPCRSSSGKQVLLPKVNMSSAPSSSSKYLDELTRISHERLTFHITDLKSASTIAPPWARIFPDATIDASRKSCQQATTKGSYWNWMNLVKLMGDGTTLGLEKK